MRARAFRAAHRLSQPHAARHEPRAAAGPGRGRVRGAAAGRARGSLALLRALAARADRTRSPSSAGASTTCRWPSSWPPPARRRSRPSRSSSGSPSGSTCSRAAATPIPASRRCGRRSSGRYELLSAEEQQLFARLSVFAGGCTLEAAEEVCDADLDTLQSLVEKSLLRFTDGRYWMLETIREYAATAARGNRAKKPQSMQRLVDFILKLAVAARGDVRNRWRSWSDSLREQDNFRRALAWRSVRAAPPSTISSAAAGPSGGIAVIPAEGLRWVESALGRERGGANRASRRRC